MKKIFVYAFILIYITGFVAASPGAIWTTRDDCGNETQDVNHFAVSEDVYINGRGFSSDTLYNWSITGQPGGASCDPSSVVASGSATTNGSGDVCFKAYTVQNDDCGEYKADFNNKHDNYRVDSGVSVPEFMTPAIALIILLTSPAFAYLLVNWAKES